MSTSSPALRRLRTMSHVQPAMLVVSALACLLAVSLGRPSSAHAEEGTVEHSETQKPNYAAPNPDLKPSTKYSGRTPIDLTNGLLFNNGTYGLPNKNYEKWAETPVVVPGLSELTYPFSEKNDFVSACEESADFVESAIYNWKQSTAITKPEAKEYGEKSAQTMQPLLERLNDAIHSCKSSNKGDWEKAQSDARRALIEMRATYSSLHRNVH